MPIRRLSRGDNTTVNKAKKTQLSKEGNARRIGIPLKGRRMVKEAMPQMAQCFFQFLKFVIHSVAKSFSFEAILFLLILLLFFGVFLTW